jgi:mono/diheme cytochrome c family protein
VKAGTYGMGGERFDRHMHLPGVFYAPNLTPAALGEWTDGEILRAFTCGVTRDGAALFPIMPYPHFAHMARPDAEAVIAYLRTLPPIEHEVPEREVDFPMNVIMRMIPADAEPQPVPAPADTVAYGEYLVTIAGCSECHTPRQHGDPVPGMDFAGGAQFPVPGGGTVRSANITPDAVTGIGAWTQARFVARFEAYEGARDPVAPGAFNTVMPWTQYAGMTRQDLGAIYAYLRTMAPVRHRVERFTPGE